MSAHLVAVMAIVCLALSVIAYAWMPRPAHRHNPVRDYYDEDAQHWTTALPVAPEPKPVTALIDLTPGIDLGLRDDCELLWSMPAYGETAADHTTASEGDL